MSISKLDHLMCDLHKQAADKNELQLKKRHDFEHHD